MSVLFSHFVFVLLSSNLLFSQPQTLEINYNWEISNPIFSPADTNSFCGISVKDPSIVYFENRWHLFFTARSNNEYTTGYVSAKNLNELNTSKRHELKTIRGKTRYGCAPQIFYFEPQNKWFLIFQNRDSNYQPAFSTNSTLSEPENWSKAKNLIEKDEAKKWIDFWVISDKQNVYLFYTVAHSGVFTRSTKIADFPNNWGSAKKVLDNVHEAVHIYKVKNKPEFHMFYELNENGVRSFGMAKTNSLQGKWEKTKDEYASGNQLKFETNAIKWTDMVSHGEIIRTGYNQFMEYEPENCRWIIQGILNKELYKNYEMLPWQLGIMTKLN